MRHIGIRQETTQPTLNLYQGPHINANIYFTVPKLQTLP